VTVGSFYARVRARALLPFAGTIVGVRTERPAVALTFDDGPNPEVTPRLLDLFERHGAKGTHFMIGALAERFPALVGEVAARGHVVANHTYSHPSLSTLGRRGKLAEVERCEAALGTHASRLFRPPYGHLDARGAATLRRRGYGVVTWSAHCQDWDPVDAGTLAERLRRGIRPGAVVLLHEALYTVVDPAANDRGPLLEALDTVLGELAGEIEFLTVPELLTLGPARRRLWERSAPQETMDVLQAGSVQSMTA